MVKLKKLTKVKPYKIYVEELKTWCLVAPVDT